MVQLGLLFGETWYVCVWPFPTPAVGLALMRTWVLVLKRGEEEGYCQSPHYIYFSLRTGSLKCSNLESTLGFVTDILCDLGQGPSFL